MQCEELKNHFSDYLSETLAEPARSEVFEHLSACASCASEVEDLKRLWVQLGSIPPEKPAANARARFDRMIDTYAQGLEQHPSGWWASLSGRWIRIALQFSTAVVLLTAGMWIGRQSRVPATSALATNELTELRSEIVSMRQMIVVSLLQQQSASERLRGVSWSEKLDMPGGDVLSALLDTLMHDPNVNVRLATVDALRQFGGQDIVRRGVVQALSREDSPLVQLELIDLVVDLKEKQSMPALRQLSMDEKSNADVRSRAERGLAELE